MKFILNGICGRMGSVLNETVKSGYRGAEIAAGVDINCSESTGVPCYKSLEDVQETADCIIDYSNHVCTPALMAYAVSKKLPVIIATTGHTEEELEIIRSASKEIPVFLAANMSLGVSLLVELAKITAKTMPDADIEIVEKHHNRKLDAPSGTALMIANALKQVREKANLVLGRSGFAKREKDDIGIHAVRAGNIIGEHEVIISTDYETITLKHEAHTRALFAQGAVVAAEFLIRKPAGFYAMQDMIGGEE